MVGELTIAIESLQVGDFHGRWDSAKQVQAFGDEAIPELLSLVQDDDQDWDVRWFAARSLGQWDQPQVVAALVALFSKTNDDDLHSALGEALTQIGPSAIQALTELLANPLHRPVAVRALANINHGATVAPLLSVADDPREQVRATVLNALTKFSEPQARSVVARGIEDPSSQVRLAALRALVSLKPYLDEEELVTWLTPRLGDINLEVVRQVVYLLGRLEALSATEALVTLAQTPTTPEMLRVAVVQSLGWQATPVAVNGLIAIWTGATVPVRLEIIRALSLLQPPELRATATTHLIEWLAELPTTVALGRLRQSMVLTLGTLGQETAFPCLTDLLIDEDRGVRLHAEAALRSLGVDPAHLPLAQNLTQRAIAKEQS
ncbi:MAG: HEAT repeat domain-containing protein [Leptolyngbyaceae cyanobacterium SM2_3_12]|nr:HEAT repeat domain-containing protein [Leptolyngbyaceae cyanobacterium SM2_3_12]